LLGEFGADSRQDATNCKSAVQNMINYINGDGKDVYVGWTWWTSGRGYGADQHFNLQLGANYAATIMSWLQTYLQAASTTWTAAEVSDSNDSFMKQNIYILVGAIVIVLLVVIVVVTLRSRSRKRGNSYVRESVDSGKASEQSAPIALTATSSAADLEAVSQQPEQDMLSSAEPTVTTSTPEWQLQTNETGKQYYYNNSTGQSQWETPDATVASV